MHGRLLSAFTNIQNTDGREVRCLHVCEGQGRRHFLAEFGELVRKVLGPLGGCCGEGLACSPPHAAAQCQRGHRALFVPPPTQQLTAGESESTEVVRWRHRSRPLPGAQTLQLGEPPMSAQS